MASEICWCDFFILFYVVHQPSFWDLNFITPPWRVQQIFQVCSRSEFKIDASVSSIFKYDDVSRVHLIWGAGIYSSPCDSSLKDFREPRDNLESPIGLNMHVFGVHGESLMHTKWRTLQKQDPFRKLNFGPLCVQAKHLQNIKVPCMVYMTWEAQSMKQSLEAFWAFSTNTSRTLYSLTCAVKVFQDLTSVNSTHIYTNSRQ